MKRLSLKKGTESAKGLDRRTGKAVWTLASLSVVAAVLMLGQTARAQSTIFNIPTTDTVAPKKGYLEFDYFGQAPKADGVDRVNIYVPRGITGVTKNIEAGANIGITHSGSGNLAYFQPNAKWRFFSTDSGWATAIGGILYTPLNYRDNNPTYGLLYANVSKKMKGAYGPRFTVGPYGVVGGDTLFSGLIKAGAIVGYEQPVYKRLSFVADWYSGKNAFGYFTPGISIAVPGNGLFNAGYSIGNDSYKGSNANHNRFVFLYYGITF